MKKILRKGAISAHKKEKVLIPINMRDGSIIALGRGNKEWNYSAPHGAGRVYSRKQAKEKISLEEFKNICCLGELVHNKQVTNELEKKGIRFIDDISKTALRPRPLLLPFAAHIMAASIISSIWLTRKKSKIM